MSFTLPMSRKQATPTIRAYIVGENENTGYVCPACHAAHYAAFEVEEAWAVTANDGLDIPYCEDCGVEIDG
jgi:hypothetical protein